jgi:hypothetical protein
VLALSERIGEAIETYRKAEAESGQFDDWSGPVAAAAVALADLVVEAHDAWHAEYRKLTPFQRSVLARVWRGHRRSLVLEERGQGPAGRPAISVGRVQTVEALERLGMIDGDGHLTAGGQACALRAWEEAGSVDLKDPFALSA